MLVTPTLLDDIRRRLARGNSSIVAQLSPTGYSLGAVMELACATVCSERDRGGVALSTLEPWGTLPLQFEQARKLLLGDASALAPVETFAAPAVELFAVVKRTGNEALEWDLYRQRFNRSLINNGLAKNLSHALSKALAEMADNVIQHSGTDEDHPAAGLVGYHVGHRQMSFAVADLGRGVLASLRTNPRWRSIPDSMQALEAAVSRRASRRIEEAEGSGFRQVHKSLADLYGHLRFRTGDAVLTLDGRGESRAARIASSPGLPGFQITVSCALDSIPAESPL